MYCIVLYCIALHCAIVADHMAEACARRPITHIIMGCWIHSEYHSWVSVSDQIRSDQIRSDQIRTYISLPTHQPTTNQPINTTESTETPPCSDLFLSERVLISDMKSNAWASPYNSCEVCWIAWSGRLDEWIDRCRYWQMRLQGEFYHKMRRLGVFVNAPDVYFAHGVSEQY